MQKRTGRCISVQAWCFRGLDKRVGIGSGGGRELRLQIDGSASWASWTRSTLMEKSRKTNNTKPTWMGKVPATARYRLYDEGDNDCVSGIDERRVDIPGAWPALDNFDIEEAGSVHRTSIN